jgi:uncharacterized membrane protein (UPF0127 family)
MLPKSCRDAKRRASVFCRKRWISEHRETFEAGFKWFLRHFHRSQSTVLNSWKNLSSHDVAAKLEGVNRARKTNPKQIVSLALIAILALAGWLFFASEKPAAINPPLSVPVTFAPVQHLLHAQPKLPTVRVFLGTNENSQEMIAEICREPVEIATGMMFRTKMAENEAMIFIFPNSEPRNFYMRNCLVPLSAAYVEPDGKIAEIIDLQPGDERGVQSRTGNIQFVLEVPQGWFKRHSITNGDVIRTERGSLIETFIRQ